MPQLKPTADPDVFIEQQKKDYVRYWRTDGLRWEVLGTCARQGHCMVGAVLADGTEIDDPDHLQQLVDDGIITESHLDTPVAPGFNGC